MRGLAALLILVATAACQHATAPADADPRLGAAAASGALTTDRQSYAAGATGSLRLSNRYPHALGYNLCHSVLERRVGDQWRTAEGEDQRVCTMELRILEAAGTASYSFALASSLPAGEYRFRTQVENMSTGAREPLVSNTFRVTG